MTINFCKICNKKFAAKPSHIRKGWGIYCSRNCKIIASRVRSEVTCFICGKNLLKTATQLKRSKSGKYFCNKSCQTIWRNSQFVGPKHSNFKTGRRAYSSILNRHKVEQRCGLCRTKDIRVLNTHHVDENHRNNNIGNLAWLCHNCHHLVHYDSLSKKKFLAKRMSKL